MPSHVKALTLQNIMTLLVVMLLYVLVLNIDDASTPTPPNRVLVASPA